MLKYNAAVFSNWLNPLHRSEYKQSGHEPNDFHEWKIDQGNKKNLDSNRFLKQSPAHQDDSDENESNQGVNEGHPRPDLEQECPPIPDGLFHWFVLPVGVELAKGHGRGQLAGAITLPPT